MLKISHECWRCDPGVSMVERMSFRTECEDEDLVPEASLARVFIDLTC